MARTPNSVGFQPRTTPAERRADLDLRRLIAEYRAEHEADVAALEAVDAALDGRLDTAEAKLTQLETAKCQVTRTALQSVASGSANVLVSYDTEQYDPQGWWSSGNPTVVVPNVLGLYRVTAWVEWTTDTDYTRRLMDVQFNGVMPSTPSLRSELPNQFTVEIPHHFVTPLMLADGVDDTFGIRVFQQNTSAGAASIQSTMLVELVVDLS